MAADYDTVSTGTKWSVSVHIPICRKTGQFCVCRDHLTWLKSGYSNKQADANTNQYSGVHLILFVTQITLDQLFLLPDVLWFYMWLCIFIIVVQILKTLNETVTIGHVRKTFVSHGQLLLDKLKTIQLVCCYCCLTTSFHFLTFHINFITWWSSYCSFQKISNCQHCIYRDTHDWGLTGVRSLHYC